MKNVFKRAAKGAHVPHHKNTQNSATVDMPVPAKILLPMQQHIGAAAVPVVKEGDPVFVGTVVGDVASPLSAPMKSIPSDAGASAHAPNDWKSSESLRMSVWGRKSTRL